MHYKGKLINIISFKVEIASGRTFGLQSAEVITYLSDVSYDLNVDFERIAIEQSTFRRTHT